MKKISLCYGRQFIVLILSFFLLSACTLPVQTGADESGAAASAAEETAVGEAEAVPVDETDQGAATEPAPDSSAGNGAAGAAPAAGSSVFRIVPELSEVRFTLNEVLLGSLNVVVGVTNQLSGELVVDPANPANTTIGEIQIDASTFATDNDRRNVAIRRYILQSARPEYQYITFRPTAIDGLPSSAAVGDELSFQVSGDLKIRDIVKPVIFDVTVSVVSADELTGTARATLTRTDFELDIPSVPSVTDVSDEVGVEFDFTARAG